MHNFNYQESYLDYSTMEIEKIEAIWKELSMILLTFGLTVLAWIFFRAENLGHAFSYIAEIFSTSLLDIPRFTGMKSALVSLVLICVLLVIEWLGRDQQYAIQHLGFKWKRPVRYSFYYAILLAIFWFSGKEQAFIYFQF